MKKLLEEDALMAYQIGFELYENAPQGFLNTVAHSLRGVTPSPLPADVSLGLKSFLSYLDFIDTLLEESHKLVPKALAHTIRVHGKIYIDQSRVVIINSTG